MVSPSNVQMPQGELWKIFSLDGIINLVVKRLDCPDSMLAMRQQTVFGIVAQMSQSASARETDSGFQPDCISLFQHFFPVASMVAQNVETDITNLDFKFLNSPIKIAVKNIRILNFK